MDDFTVASFSSRSRRLWSTQKQRRMLDVTNERLGPGKRVEFGDWGRRRRTGEVLQVEGSLLQMQYRPASGQLCIGRVDVLHLVGGQWWR
jgi:hypothetical protein